MVISEALWFTLKYCLNFVDKSAMLIKDDADKCNNSDPNTYVTSLTLIIIFFLSSV